MSSTISTPQSKTPVTHSFLERFIKRSDSDKKAYRPGMGAIPDESGKGVTFRVWCPDVDSVSVIGTFNDWNPEKNPMKHEDSGYWAVNISNAKLGDGYKFHIIKGEMILDKNDPYARLMTHSSGHSIIYHPQMDWSDDQYNAPPINEWIIYEMHIGTFNRPKPDQIGTFKTAIKKLPYLKELGINVIELMPTNEFAGGISWGYNPANPFAVESDYGGPDGLQEFVKAAHQHGIAVVLDVVYNHFGPGDLDLWRFNGWYEEDGGGIYFYNDWKKITPWGSNRPDYGRNEVRQYIRDNAIMWLNDYHLDGLRFDATCFIRNLEEACAPSTDIPEGWTLLQWITDEAAALGKNKVIIAEDLKNLEYIVYPTSQGGAGFHSQWDGLFVHTMRRILTQPTDDARDMAAVCHAIENRFYGDAFRRIVYTESHDEVANGKTRLTEAVQPGHADSSVARERSILGAAAVLTAPGIPMIFQGQEFLEDRWFDDNRPLDWNRAKEFDYVLAAYRDLIRLRRNWENNTRGLLGQHMHIFHVNHEKKVVAYRRWAEGGPGDDTIVVLNFANEAQEGYRIGVPNGGTWYIRYNSGWEGYGNDRQAAPTVDSSADTISIDGYDQSCMISFKPYSAIILSQ